MGAAMALEAGIDRDLAPLVVVEGFLGDPGLDCWRHLIECQSRRRRVISVRLGPLSSIHDRCCELFYQIKGGRVDYGVHHAKEMGHDRYGLTHVGAYPQWSREHPVHFLGHSLGGLTAWHLQQMLHRKDFGHDTDASWIRSLATFSAPLRGTTLTYILGCHEGNPAQVREWTTGAFLYRLVYVLAWLGLSVLHLVMFNPSLAHWQLHRHSFLELLGNLLAGARFDGGRDNAAHDLTVEVADAMNRDAVTFAATYYRSYAVSLTSPCMSLFHVPEPTRRGPLVVLLASLMGGFAFAKLPYPSEEWRDNDSIVPVISQCHPGECRRGFCCHRTFDQTGASISAEPRAGEWAVTHINDASHFEVIRCPLPVLPPSYRTVMQDYWRWVDQIDSTFGPPKPSPRPKPSPHKVRPLLAVPISPFVFVSPPDSPIPFPSSPIPLR